MAAALFRPIRSLAWRWCCIIATWRACVSHWGVPQLGGIRPLPPLSLSPTPYTLYHLESVSACHSPSLAHTRTEKCSTSLTHSLMLTHVFMYNCSIYHNRCVQTFSSLATTTMCTSNFEDIWVQGQSAFMKKPPPPFSQFPPFFFFLPLLVLTRVQLHCPITLSICWEEVRQTMCACVCVVDHIWESAAGTAITPI